MTPDTTLVLGDFEFARWEIPTEIAVGGVQQLVVHELVGGIRVIDALGRRDNALEWSGWFMGHTALARSNFLDGYRIAGTTLSLTWSEFKFQVIVREFVPTVRRQFEIAYRIVCEVVANLAAVFTQDSVPPIDSAVNDDLDSANVYAGSVGDSSLTGLMATLTSAIAAVPTFSRASRSTLNSVLQPLAGALTRTSILTASGNGAIAAAPGFGGIVPNAAPGAAAGALTAQLAVMQELTALYRLEAVLGRMGANLGAISDSEDHLTVAGGNLFQLASQRYGDATAWTTIAQANGLTDPVVQGTQMLTLPATAGSSGGILEA